MRSPILQYFTTQSTSSPQQLPERHELDARYQWRTEDIYPSVDAWEADFQNVESLLPRLKAFQGKLGESSQTLRECLQLRDQIDEILGRLYLYAGLKNDEDTRNATFQALRDRVMGLSVKFNEASAFIHPEILAIPEEKLWAFVEQDNQLAVYRHYLEDLVRTRDHVLPPEQERLLAMAGEVAQGPYTIFSMFNNADIKFPVIKDEDGNRVELTKGRYSKFMESKNRRVRKAAYHAFYGTYQKWLNTLSATLSTGIKRDVFYARARKYASALEAALDSDNIPVQVYDNVVNTINANLTPLHRYMAYRRRRLGIRNVQPYDLFVPLVEEMRWEIPYEEAKSILLDALAPLGDTYLAALKEGLEGGWIDVYENQGKRAGAYSWSTYGVHPFVLLNYQGTLNDLFTLAHEMGHALHSYFTHKHQPYIYSHYTIFVAEVASTTNEALLMHYMLQHTRDPQKKLYLLNEYADQIRGTVYIQTLFAEFERTIHEMVENGQPLTVDVLNQLKGELYQRYFGPAFHLESKYPINWCRIPHFYYNYYVFKYVTGYASATAISRMILGGESGARERYLQFLSAGSSKYSIDLLKDAGVDITRPDPLEATTQLLDALVHEMEALTEK